MTIAEKKRYYSPTRYKTAELDTSLNEFTVDELRVELAHREGKVIDGDPRDTPDAEQYSMSIYTTNRLRADLMPDLSAVISWLENGCDPKEAVKELRLYQSRRSVIAIRAAQSQCTTPPPEPQASGPAP